MSSVSVLNEEGIIKCMSYLENVQERQEVVESSLPESIASALSRFSSDFIPLEYAEKFLMLIGQVLSKAEENDQIQLFAGCKTFTNALVRILTSFESQIGMKNHGKVSSSVCSFSSHSCYETVLYVLLGLLDQTAILQQFVCTMTEKHIIGLFQALQRMLSQDELYLTQEMALEVLCRLCHYYAVVDASTFSKLRRHLGSSLSSELQRPSDAISLLQDMRPLLNRMNSSNPRIKSFPVSTFSVSTDWKALNSERVLQRGGWIDVCREKLCFNFPEEQFLLRISYPNIQELEYDITRNSVQVHLGALPRQLEDMLHPNELPPPGKIPTFTFQLERQHTDLKAVQEQLTARLAERETVIKPAERPVCKESYVSSKRARRSSTGNSSNKVSSGVLNAVVSPRPTAGEESHQEGLPQQGPAPIVDTAAESLEQDVPPEQSTSSISSPDMDAAASSVYKDSQQGEDALHSIGGNVSSSRKVLTRASRKVPRALGTTKSTMVPTTTVSELSQTLPPALTASKSSKKRRKISTESLHSLCDLRRSGISKKRKTQQATTSKAKKLAVASEHEQPMATEFDFNFDGEDFNAAGIDQPIAQELTGSAAVVGVGSQPARGNPRKGRTRATPRGTTTSAAKVSTHRKGTIPVAPKTRPVLGRAAKMRTPAGRPTLAATADKENCLPVAIEASPTATAGTRSVISKRYGGGMHKKAAIATAEAASWCGAFSVGSTYSGAEKRNLVSSSSSSSSYLQGEKRKGEKSAKTEVDAAPARSSARNKQNLAAARELSRVVPRAKRVGPGPQLASSSKPVAAFDVYADPSSSPLHLPPEEHDLADRMQTVDEEAAPPAVVDDNYYGAADHAADHAMAAMSVVEDAVVPIESNLHQELTDAGPTASAAMSLKPLNMNPSATTKATTKASTKASSGIAADLTYGDEEYLSSGLQHKQQAVSKSTAVTERTNSRPASNATAAAARGTTSAGVTAAAVAAGRTAGAGAESASAAGAVPRIAATATAATVASTCEAKNAERKYSWRTEATMTTANSCGAGQERLAQSSMQYMSLDHQTEVVGNMQGNDDGDGDDVSGGLHQGTSAISGAQDRTTSGYSTTALPTAGKVLHSIMVDQSKDLHTLNMSAFTQQDCSQGAQSNGTSIPWNDEKTAGAARAADRKSTRTHVCENAVGRSRAARSNRSRANQEPVADEFDDGIDDLVDFGSPDGVYSQESPDSSEGQSAFATLLAELVQLQKERAHRKRSKHLQVVAQSSIQQIRLFLDQWRTITSRNSSELQRTISLQLETVCARADKLSDEIGNDAEQCSAQQTEINSRLSALRRAFVELKSTFVSTESRYQDELNRMRTQLQNSKKKTLESARKTLAMYRDMRGQSSKQHKCELEKALRDM